MEEFEVKENVYRIKDMNAIELLSMKSQINFTEFSKAYQCYSLMLEKMEVKVGDKWLPVKSGNIYLPNGIEKDIDVIKELTDKMMEYLLDYFHKSNESKRKHV